MDKFKSSITFIEVSKDSITIIGKCKAKDLKSVSRSTDEMF